MLRNPSSHQKASAVSLYWICYNKAISLLCVRMWTTSDVVGFLWSCVCETPREVYWTWSHIYVRAWSTLSYCNLRLNSASKVARLKVESNTEVLVHSRSFDTPVLAYSKLYRASVSMPVETVGSVQLQSGVLLVPLRAWSKLYRTRVSACRDRGSDTASISRIPGLCELQACPRTSLSDCSQ